MITNPNCLLAGVVGKGKSCLAKSLATRSIAFGRRVYVPGDPKGEWTVVAKAVGGAAIELGGGSPNRLNPHDDEPAQMAYAQSLADWADAGGYEHETLWDVCTVAAIGIPFEQAQWRSASTLSGGEQKRLVLEALLPRPEEVLVLDEPDNYLDVPAKGWLEDQLIASPKTVLFISHDRELLDRVATRIATLEPAAAGSTLWVHPGRFSTYHQARTDRNSRLEELRRRWDEEHAKLKALVLMYKTKAATTTGWPVVTRRPGPGWRSSRRLGRTSWSRTCRTSGCGSRGVGRPSGR